VPNHCGREHPWFAAAVADASAPTSEFFSFTKHPEEYASWLGHRSLPRLNYRSQRLREYMIAGPEAIFRRWLRKPYSIDGWRVDVANMLDGTDPTTSALNSHGTSDGLSRRRTRRRISLRSISLTLPLCCRRLAGRHDELRGLRGPPLVMASHRMGSWQHWEPFSVSTGSPSPRRRSLNRGADSGRPSRGPLPRGS